jgi:DNA-binding Xre family transcriptional regulator
MQDYSGVATRDLAAFLEKVAYEPISLQHAVGITTRDLLRITTQEYQFTGLNIADKICVFLGYKVDDVFTIIPKHTITSSLKMAEDQFRDHNEEIQATQEELFARAAELRDLRAEVLGEKTDEQKQKLAQDRARAKRNASKALSFGRSAAFAV